MFAGMALGAFVWGFIADIHGRLYVFHRSLLVAGIAGLFVGLTPNFGLSCLLVAVVGMGVGGSMPIDGALLIETLPLHKRHWLTALSVFFALGSVLCALMAYAILPGRSCMREHACTNPNHGWRILTTMLSCTTLVLVAARFCLCRVHESPLFLAENGRLDDAHRVLDAIELYNKGRCDIFDPVPDGQDDNRMEYEVPACRDGGIDQDLQHQDNVDPSTEADEGPLSTGIESGRIPAFASAFFLSSEWGGRCGLLFALPQRHTTLTIWCLWGLLSFAFTIFNAFFPLYLQRKGSFQASTSFVQTLRSLIWYALSSVPGSVIGAALVKTAWGHLYALPLTLGLTAAALGFFALAQASFTVVCAGMLVSFCATTAYAILYGLTPALFPTLVRGTACAAASALGRFTGMLAPLVAGPLLAWDPTVPVCLSIVLFVLCTLLALQLSRLPATS